MLNSYSKRVSAGLLMTTLLATPAMAEDWVMAGFIAPADQRIAELIATLTGDAITIDLKKPGEIAHPLKLREAIEAGDARLAVTAPVLLDLDQPALALFTSVPFGPAAVEYLAWIDQGGGLELHDRLYAAMGLRGIPCRIVTAEASGWFREKITSVDQLDGMSMRIFGIAGQVVQRLGVEPVLTSMQEVKDAMQSGEVDAAEYSTPAGDLWRNMHEVADHYYFPGWHQPSTVMDLVMLDATWQELPEVQRRQIEAACRANMMQELLVGETVQTSALAQIEEHGVQIHRWSESILAAFETAWLEVVEENSAKDPEFGETWQSLQSFRSGYARWAELGHID